MSLFYTYPFLIGFVSFAIGAICMPFVIKIARDKHFLARPNKRTCHKGEIPNVGGVDICFSFMLTYLIFEFGQLPQSQFFLIGVFAIVMIGFVDDVLVLTPTSKLLGEFVAGIAIIGFADIRITHLQGIFGFGEIGIISSYVISFFVLIALTNAINLIDGVDGLASGLGMIYCLFFAIFFYISGQSNWSILAICMMGSLAVFFCYNVFGGSRRKIFMGDSGSLLLGYIMTAFVFQLCEHNAYHLSPETTWMHAAPVVCICVFTIPLWDTCRVSITRICNHRSPFSPDTNHIHHWLLRLGLNHIQTTCVLLSISLLCIALGILGRNWNMWVLLLADGAVYSAFIGVLWLFMKRKNTPSPSSKL